MSSRLRLSIVFACMMAGAICSRETRAQVQPLRIWRFRLEDFGWQPSPRPPRDAEHPGSRSNQVAIDHDGHVLVGFAVRENYGLATRGHPGISFHMLGFTPQGKTDFSLALPTNNHFSNGFYLGQKDRLIARANNTLQVISEAKDGLGRVAESHPLMPCSENCLIHQSPSHGRMIVSESKDSLGRSTIWETKDTIYTLIDTVSEPRILRTCSQMAFYGRDITDRFAYWFGTEGSEHFARRFLFCDLENPEELPLNQVGVTFPLSDGAFLSLGHDPDNLNGIVQVVVSDGHTKFRHVLPKHDHPTYYSGARAVSDERGNYFAFTVDTWRGGSRILDISGKLVARRIVVYSEGGRELASLPVSTAYRFDFDFALSPDGRRLAVLDEGVLTIVDVD